MSKINVDSIGKRTGTYVTFEDPVDMGANTITTTAIPTADADFVPYAYTQYAHYHNYIMNGAMSIAQRGTSFAAIATGAYHLDRWLYAVVGAAVHTITQDSDVPTTSTTQYSLKVDCTTADAAIAAGDYCTIEQRIEGYVFRPLVGKTATLSFWVKATKTGIYCVSFRNSGVSDRSYVVEYTINTTDTWEYKTITLTFDYSGGTWDYTNGIGLRVNFSLSGGSTFQTTKDAWQTGNYLVTANQVNGTDSTSNNFFLTEVMLNEGSVAQPFKLNGINFEGELRKCQRYYEKSFDYGTVPADATASYAGVIAKVTTATISYHSMGTVYYRTTKRAAVIPVFYNPIASSASKIRNVTDSANVACQCEVSNTAYGDAGFACQVNNSSIAANKQLVVHWVDDAEL